MKVFKSIVLILLFLSSFAPAQNPGKEWLMYKSPENAGYSSAKLELAKNLYDSLGSASFMFIDDGKVVVAWGDYERRFKCHSIRKSFLSGMYGVHVEAGDIDLNKTIGELQITDNLPLTDDEKSAKIKDLLKARSGIYLPAAYETDKMKERRPKRSSHKPNTFWYYNNWDFNVLAVIYKLETGKDVFLDFKKLFADPLQMQDYRVIDGYYHVEPENSIYPAYPFRMSARDMARYGLMFLRNGKWNDSQLVSSDWIKESTTSYSNTGKGGYSYLWWNGGAEGLPGLYTARGSGGHVIGVVPDLNVVFVHRSNTFKGPRIAYNNVFKIAELISKAKISEPKKNAELIEIPKRTNNINKIDLTEDDLTRYKGNYHFRNRDFTVVLYKDELLLVSPSSGKYKLIPVSKDKFLIEDWEDYAVFNEESGKLNLIIE